MNTSANRKKHEKLSNSHDQKGDGGSSTWQEQDRTEHWLGLSRGRAPRAPEGRAHLMRARCAANRLSGQNGFLYPASSIGGMRRPAKYWQWTARPRFGQIIRR